MDAPIELPHRCRKDWLAVVMLVITIAALAGVAWLRYRARSSTEATAAAIGAEAPPLRLLDLKTSESLVLVGLRGRVVWVVFWSADSPDGASCLPELEAVWKR